MDSNLKHTLDIFDNHKGEIVLIEGTVQRFIGIAEDEDDYLYIMWDGRKKTTCHTILSHIVLLKGFIKDDDYEMFVNIAKLNDLTCMDLSKIASEKSRVEATSMIIQLKADELIKLNTRGDRGFKMLSELYWDLV